MTALTCHESGDVFFVGKEDGPVWLYDVKSGEQKQKLFNHAEGVAIVTVLFDEGSQILSSADTSSRLLSHKLIRKANAWDVTEACFSYRAGETINQLLSNHGHTRMLMCSPNIDTLHAFTPAGTSVERIISWKNRGSFRWGRHPPNPDQLILIMGNTVHICE